MLRLEGRGLGLAVSRLVCRGKGINMENAHEEWQATASDGKSKFVWPETSIVNRKLRFFGRALSYLEAGMLHAAGWTGPGLQTESLRACSWVFVRPASS